MHTIKSIICDWCNAPTVSKSWKKNSNEISYFIHTSHDTECHRTHWDSASSQSSPINRIPSLISLQPILFHMPINLTPILLSHTYLHEGSFVRPINRSTRTPWDVGGNQRHHGQHQSRVTVASQAAVLPATPALLLPPQSNKDIL